MVKDLNKAEMNETEKTLLKKETDEIQKFNIKAQQELQRQQLMKKKQEAHPKLASTSTIGASKKFPQTAKSIATELK